MSSIHENALRILRVLYERGAIEAITIIKEELRNLSSLEPSEFDPAYHYLAGADYVSTYGMGEEGSISISALGVEHLESILSKRLALSLDAELLLSHLVKNNNIVGNWGYKNQLMKDLGLDQNRYEDACRLLTDFELIGGESSGCRQIYITQDGRQAVHRGFVDPQA